MSTMQFDDYESAKQYYRAVKCSYAENVVRVRLPKDSNHVFVMVRPIELDLESLAKAFGGKPLRRGGEQCHNASN